MYKLTILLMIVVAVLLVIAVLLQNSKSDGMSSSLGNMGGNQLIGVKKTANALEQITWGLAIGLFGLAIVATLLLKRQQREVLYSANVESAAEKMTSSDMNLDEQSNYSGVDAKCNSHNHNHAEHGETNEISKDSAIADDKDNLEGNKS